MSGFDKRRVRIHIKFLAHSKGCPEPSSHSHLSRSSAQEQDLVLDLYGSACTLMATRYAFVTLITSDSYLPGALTLAAALRDIHPTPAAKPEVDFQTACLVTPETVDVSSIKLLRGAFDIVIGVEIIENGDRKGLELLGESRCSISGAKAVWAKRSSGPVAYEVDLYGLPWDATLVHDFPHDAFCDDPSERSRTRRPIDFCLELVSSCSPQVDSNPLLQEDLISASLSPSFMRSDSPSSPRSSTSIPMCYPFAPSLTCSLWTTSFLLFQTSGGRTSSILE